MKKFLMIDTTWPINSRTERFRLTLLKKYDVFVSAWNRGGVLDKCNNQYFIMESNIGYGSQLKKLLHLPFFIIHNIKAYKKIRPEVVFASHWDSLICAVIIKIFFKKTKIIYDCLDMPSSSNIFLLKCARFFERLSLKKTSVVILASRYFKEFYVDSKNLYVYENYPSEKTLQKSIEIPKWFDGFDQAHIENLSKKSLSWVGVVRYIEIIENILDAINKTEIVLFVFGVGPDLNKLKQLVVQKEMENQVFFFGRYEMKDLGFIYNISNLIWAAYPTKDLNVIHAISNKYFECSYYNKQPIFSKKTKMAENLKDNPSVILVDEYSIGNIRGTLIEKVKNKDAFFCKYEEDLTWEDKESFFLDYINENI